MAHSILELKKLKKAAQENLANEFQRINAPTYSDADDSFWYPEVDKAGNGYAVIRFLPAPKGEDIPFVRVFQHSFKGPTGSWYINNYLSTIGKPDPVNELNQKLWNSGVEANKEIVRKQKRKLTYIANILVVTDSQKPENEGKVFRFKFGKKLFDKLNDAMNPKFQDETPMNPFDPWDGANFKLKIRTVEGYRNYDKSEFDKPTPISKSDDDIDAIWSQTLPLQELVSPDKFKSYEELKAQLERVLNGSEEVPAAREEPQVAKKTPAKARKVDIEDPQSAEDDDLDVYARLAEKD